MILSCYRGWHRDISQCDGCEGGLPRRTIREDRFRVYEWTVAAYDTLGKRGYRAPMSWSEDVPRRLIDGKDRDVRKLSGRAQEKWARCRETPLADMEGALKYRARPWVGRPGSPGGTLKALGICKSPKERESKNITKFN